MLPELNHNKPPAEMPKRATAKRLRKRRTKAAKAAKAASLSQRLREPVGLEEAIRLRQAELGSILFYRCPRLTKPTFWGGAATALDYLGPLSNYGGPLNLKEQEAEIEQCFADAFVHFGLAFSHVANEIGHPIKPRE